MIFTICCDIFTLKEFLVLARIITSIFELPYNSCSHVFILLFVTACNFIKLSLAELDIDKVPGHSDLRPPEPKLVWCELLAAFDQSLTFEKYLVLLLHEPVHVLCLLKRVDFFFLLLIVRISLFTLSVIFTILLFLALLFIIATLLFFVFLLKAFSMLAFPHFLFNCFIRDNIITGIV